MIILQRFGTCLGLEDVKGIGFSFSTQLLRFHINIMISRWPFFCIHSVCPCAAGTQQFHTHTPARRGRTLETALMRIGSMDPGSGPFGAALAAAERASITPKHKISRSLSQVCSPTMPITCLRKVTRPYTGGGEGRGWDMSMSCSP